MTRLQRLKARRLRNEIHTAEYMGDHAESERLRCELRHMGAPE